MFEDILNFSDPVIENNIEVANFLGLDQDIAIEGAKEFIDGTKKRIQSAVEKIAAFIQRITNKVKEIFYKLTKKGTYKIDQDIYRKLINANKLNNASIPQLKFVVAGIKATKIASKVIENEDYSKIKVDVEKWNKITDDINENFDAFEKSSDFEYVNKITSGEIKTDKDGKKNIVLKAEHLNNTITGIQTALTTMEEVKKALMTAADAIDDKTTVNSKVLASAMGIITITIRSINNNMKIYNAINIAAIGGTAEK